MNDLLDPEFETLKRHWYGNRSVLMNIIDALKHREGVFLRSGHPQRCLKINAEKYWHKNTKRYHFFDEPLNLYGSLARLPDMPMFSFNRKEKQEQMQKFNKDFVTYAKGYDFLFDIDNPDLDSAYTTLLDICEEFDTHHIPYYVMFSGVKGFHIRVDYEYMPTWMRQLTIPKLVQKLKAFAERFKTINNYKDIDTTIFDMRRIAKTPYSIVYPKEPPSMYLVALPLTRAQTERFDLKMVSLKHLLNKTQDMFMRRNCIRPGLPSNFGKLVNNYLKD